MTKSKVGIHHTNCSEESTAFSHDYTNKKESNIDYKDVKFFEALSSKWWDFNVSRGLQLLNNLRVPFIRDGLINVGSKPLHQFHSLEGLKVIDIACGGGILSEPLAKMGASVTGIDASGELIEVAKHHASLDPETSNITYIKSSAEEMAETHHEEFDAVIASEIVEHIMDIKSFLQACTHLLKPGGSIFITTFNKTLASYLEGIIMAEYIIGLIPKGTHNWNQFVSPEEIGRILNEYHCDTKLVHGVTFDYIRRDWIWCKKTSVAYALQAVKSNPAEQ